MLWELVKNRSELDLSCTVFKEVKDFDGPKPKSVKRIKAGFLYIWLIEGANRFYIHISVRKNRPGPYLGSSFSFSDSEKKIMDFLETHANDVYDSIYAGFVNPSNLVESNGDKEISPKAQETQKVLDTEQSDYAVDWKKIEPNKEFFAEFPSYQEYHGALGAIYFKIFSGDSLSGDSFTLHASLNKDVIGAFRARYKTLEDAKEAVEELSEEQIDEILEYLDNSSE